jgi:hypothetical protein
MRSRLALAIWIGTAASALADSAPVLVIPGRPGVPIIINGIDASYAVVEGDWGLAQRVHVTPTVYGGRYVDPLPNVGHYYPNRRLPQPAASYHQSWSAQSAPQAAQPEIPLNPPSIILAPQDGAAGLPQDFLNTPQNFRHRRPGGGRH